MKLSGGLMNLMNCIFHLANTWGTNFVYKAISQEVVKCSEILIVYLVDLCLFMAL